MTEQAQDTIPVTNIDQFAFLVSHWHQNRLGQLEQALSAPDDVEIIMQDDQGADFTLPPEHRAAFRAGLIVAKSLFQQLPFVLSQEPIEELDDDGNDLDLPEACEHAANVQAAGEAPVQPLLDEVIHGA